MRRNHGRNWDGHDDIVYVDLPELWGVSRIIAKPMKTIYINRSADPSIAQERVFASVSALERYCEKWDIELP